MAIRALAADLKPVELELEQLCLDPNNPRFVGSEWDYVSDDDAGSETNQATARKQLIDRFGVERLRSNMEVNGYLPIDRIVVRELPSGRYLVLEGNRRVCAAKLVAQYAVDGETISSEVKATLKKIPCLLYTGASPNAAWLFQGIRHITGLVDWSSFNKAKLLVEQMEEEDLSLTEVGKRFGLSPFGAGQWLRAYKAFLQAMEHSDYTEETDEKAYPYFMELFSRSSVAVREWMDWNDADYEFKNELNFNEYLSWIYPRSDLGDGDTQARGEFENRKIKRRDDVRNVAYLISQAPAFFEQFRRDGDIDRAYSEARAKRFEEKTSSERDPVKEAFESTEACRKSLEKFPYRAVKDEAIFHDLSTCLGKLRAVIDDLVGSNED